MLVSEDHNGKLYKCEECQGYFYDFEIEYIDSVNDSRCPHCHCKVDE